MLDFSMVQRLVNQKWGGGPPVGKLAIREMTVQNKTKTDLQTQIALCSLCPFIEKMS